MKFKNDVTMYGLINIISVILLLIITEYLLHKKSVMFEGFEKIHYFIWYGAIISQIVYILLILFMPEKYAQSGFGKRIYNLFTIGGFKSIQDVFIHSKEEPLLEFLMIFIFILIPWPIFKKTTMKHRMTIFLSKIGLFHLISSLTVTDWNTFHINLNYNLQ